jgi:hypothetical protein
MHSNKPKIGQMPTHKSTIPKAGGRKPPAASYPDEFGDEAYVPPQNLSPCPSCGRKFNDEALAKHKKVCQKVFQTKAKKFNIQKQRIIDGEHKDLLVNQKREERKFTGLKNKSKRTGNLPGSKKNKWATQSLAFRNAIRQARGAKPLSVGPGGVTASAVGAEEDNDFVKCPTCGRSFNENAANR